jgi:PPK2 family polyphosphate:nucleotide phosphotransferase
MTVNLHDIDPSSTPDAPGDKAATIAAAAELIGQVSDLQRRLYAENTRSVLVVLQAMDTGGKDGTIKHVFTGVNPAGVRVASFKAPSTTELAHDYLWRIHAQAPAKGEIVIFNRSHYESVLVERVHDLVPKQVWQARYDQINAFEEELTAAGTTIVKCFLHISKHEQRKRLLSRLDDPTKRWKFNSGDIEERQLWDQYMEAYQDAVNQTTTDFAPWHVVPSDHKWYRNFVVSRVLLDALERIDPQYPRRHDLDAVDRNLI